MLRPVTAVLAAVFLLSASLNLGGKIPLGFTQLSFSRPSTSIAGFELVIGLFLVASVVFSNLYVFGGALLLATVGVAEGLLSPDVQGPARDLHETMIPFVIAGWILAVLDAQNTYRASGHRTPSQKSRQVMIILQFFVGGLVALGGAAYAFGGTYPIGTVVGLVHLAVGLTGLFAGYAFLRERSWSRRFLIQINVVTILYSAFAESLAEIYGLLPPGINDALIGTIVAIIVSAAIVWLILVNKSV
jgi:hypothetical protein